MRQAATPSNYRKDIEGLRAVAILLVVCAHAKVAWLAGGFVGVDVFFVLSGYLITGLLASEIWTTGRVAFAAFYARRFRRLLPALLLMLVCAALLGAALLAPADQPEQTLAAASAALWLSNFHFAFSNLDYFSPGAETNLFLHTWSLGVEEQFYLVWPLLLIIVLARQNSIRRLQIAMLLTLGVSFAICMLQTTYSPRFAFYLMPARAWQFALGALVSLWLNPPNLDGRIEHSATLRRFSIWGGWVGFVLIITSAVLLDANTTYPGAWALLPSLGAAMVLAAGVNATNAGIGRLLSIRPMQAIGRISYAWYLWHWPILLLGAAVIDMSSSLNRSGVVTLSLALAALSYRYVERPIRRNERWISRPRVAVVGALMLMVSAHLLSFRWHDEAMHRMMQPDQIRYQRVRAATLAINSMGCDDWYRSASVHLCAFGPTGAEHTAVVMGDSVGLQWFPAFADTFDKLGWRLIVFNKSACPMVDEPIFYARIGREYTECALWRRNVLTQVAALKPDVVILGSALNYDFSRRQWIDGTARVLQSISDVSTHIYIMRPTPILPFDGPSCLAPRSVLYKALVGEHRCVAPAHTAHGDEVYEWLQDSAREFPNTNLIDMTDVICPDDLCRAERDGIIVFRDTEHLSVEFAKTTSSALASRLHLDHSGGLPRGS